MVENNVSLMSGKGIAVVVPCYKVKKQIIKVVSTIPAYIEKIYIVDDCCPENSGKYLLDNFSDSRIKIISHNVNKGVGGAMMSGYRAAIEDNMKIVVKMDGDGQMDPALIPELVVPIIIKDADYTKGNRFYNLEEIHQMPKIRLFGNAVLSLLNKMSSGYWDVFDPTNGFTAIHTDVLKKMPFSKISERYFFESDMLFRLNTLRAKVVDVPMDAYYGDEESQLKVGSIIGEFAKKNLTNLFKRIFYNYFLRDMSLASIELLLGVPLLLFGATFGIIHWYFSAEQSLPTPTGTVMLSVLPIGIGVQIILSFLSYDIENVPRRSIQKINQKIA